MKRGVGQKVLLALAALLGAPFLMAGLLVRRLPGWRFDAAHAQAAIGRSHARRHVIDAIRLAGKGPWAPETLTSWIPEQATGAPLASALARGYGPLEFAIAGGDKQII